MGLDHVLDYELRTFGGAHRFALLSYTTDATIATYYGLSQDQVHSELNALRMHVTDPRMGTYYLDGANHVLLGAPDTLHTAAGVTLLDWLTQMSTDATGWQNAGP
jgi:hypothetical protein